MHRDTKCSSPSRINSLDPFTRCTWTTLYYRYRCVLKVCPRVQWRVRAHPFVTFSAAQTARAKTSNCAIDLSGRNALASITTQRIQHPTLRQFGRHCMPIKIEEVTLLTMLRGLRKASYCVQGAPKVVAETLYDIKELISSWISGPVFEAS